MGDFGYIFGYAMIFCVCIGILIGIFSKDSIDMYEKGKISDEAAVTVLKTILHMFDKTLSQTEKDAIRRGIEAIEGNMEGGSEDD